MGNIFDSDDNENFTSEDINSVRVKGNVMYSVKTVTVNWTTYDMRRDTDSVKPSTRPNVMVRSPEIGLNVHPFWYAKVLGIFHADVFTINGPAGSSSVKRMEFLWVRWYGAQEGFSGSQQHAQMPMIGFVPSSDDFAFGFLDPAHIIRGCHLIPAFHYGRSNDLLPFAGQTLARDPGETDDWLNFYANM
jgi:hypothetical protein